MALGSPPGLLVDVASSWADTRPMLAAGEGFHLLKFLHDSAAQGSTPLEFFEGLAFLGLVWFVIDRLSR
jgi:hypothetical protein